MELKKLITLAPLAALLLSGTATLHADKLSVSLSRALMERAIGRVARSAGQTPDAANGVKMTPDAENGVQKTPDASSHLYKAPRASELIPVVISCGEGFDTEALGDLGFVTDFASGSRIHGRIPAGALEQLGDMPGVLHIGAPQRVYPAMDCAREFSGIDKAQEGVSAPGSQDLIPFTGKGVVIGVVDAGIDPTHITFMPQKEGETYRVREYVRTYGALESDEGFRADVYDTEQAILAAPVDDAVRGHGTHTSGIAAGAFRGNRFYGVAPDADLVMVSLGGDLYNDEIEYGITRALDYGDAVRKPVAVNLSLGSTYGLHTGDNDISDLLRGRDMTGRAVVFSAGNDGRNQCSLLHRFDKTKPDEELATFLLYPYGAIPIDAELLASSATGEPFDLAVSVVRVTPEESQEVYRTDFLSADELLSLDDDEFMPLLSSELTSRFPELADYFTAELYLYPGKEGSAYYTQLLYRRTIDNRNTNPYTIGVVIRSSAGAETLLTVPGALYILASRDVEGYTRGSGEQSISDNCTSPYVVSAGAWNARDSWTTLDGSHGQEAESERRTIAYYSSYGRQLLTGEQLPHVCAPGTNVCSSVSQPRRAERDMAVYSKDGRDYYWVLDSGTSMAAPVVTGTIALWMQAKPDLTRDEILYLIDTTSLYDEKCALRPEAAGAGKIDAYEGLKKILTEMLSAPLTGSDIPSQLMVRRLGDRSWECVVPAAGSSGVAELYSLSGELRQRISFSGSVFSLDLAGAAPGAVLLRAVTDKGVFTQKIILK